jgi:hypothetical protein
MSGKLKDSIESLEYYIGNPSAWESYDDKMSERIRSVVAAYEESESMFDFGTKKPSICANCGRLEGRHKSKTSECPKGKATRVGYTTYGPETFKKKKAPIKIPCKSDFLAMVKDVGIEMAYDWLKFETERRTK